MPNVDRIDIEQHRLMTLEEEKVSLLKKIDICKSKGTSCGTSCGTLTYSHRISLTSDNAEVMKLTADVEEGKKTF